MKRILTLLLAALCTANSYGQTIKTLGYNTTNGKVVAATNVVWTNSFKFSTNTIAAQVRTNLGLAWSALTNSNTATGFFGYTQPAGQEAFVVNPPFPAEIIAFTNITVAGNFSGNYTVGEDQAIGFEGGAEQTRTNLGLGWPGLTSTNAANLQSALFSTNTAPTNTSNVVAWTTIQIGTNAFRVPLYK
jgi:hypothetical protein